MRKFWLFPLCLVLILIWAASLPVNAGATDVPTAPPPPSGETKVPPPADTQPPQPTSRPGDDQPTHTPRPQRTRTAVFTATPAGSLTPTYTPTISPTATLTPTLTPTQTPTPFFNLQLTVYLDVNDNQVFDLGEGVEGLRVIVLTQGPQTEGVTQAGRLAFALPFSLAKGDLIQVQAPYLNFAKEVSYRPGEVMQVELRLDQPVYPVLLP